MGIGDTKELVIAAGCCFILLIAAAVFYIRAINDLVGYLKSQMPDTWEAFAADPFRRQGAPNTGEAIDVRQLVLGIRRLPSEDAQFRKLLWVARWRIIACAFLLAAGVVAAGLAGARI